MRTDALTATAAVDRGTAPGEDDESDFRQRVVASADQFIYIQELSVEAAAARIKSDGTDILIDLSGQKRGNRL